MQKMIVVILLLVSTLLTFNGCEPKVVYMQPKKVYLQTWDVEGPKGVKYEVYTVGTN